MPPYPSQPAPAAARTVGGKRPRGWHVAGAITVTLFVGWFIISALAATCPPPPKPVSSSGSSSSSVPCTELKSDAARALCDMRDIWADVPTTPSAKPSPMCGVASSGVDSALMLGQLVGIVVTAVLGWKRRRVYTQFRKSVFAVADYERRVPPGSEMYADLATHQAAAAHAANASTEMFLNKGYWFAPSGASTDARIDSIRATGARAAAAAQQIMQSQYAPMEDDQDDLAAPDLGGGDTTSETASHNADDWMSGVDNNDNDW